MQGVDAKEDPKVIIIKIIKSKELKIRKYK
jgi:hypothetical protein